jgi:hypothetical protein
VRVFADANILFSAADGGSATRLLFDALRRKGFELVTGTHVVEEAKRNLQLKRPVHAEGLQALLPHLEISGAFALIGNSGLPPQDVPVLCGAVGAGCSHLWTSDKRHFGTWYGKSFFGVIVVSSVMLADLLSEAASAG